MSCISNEAGDAPKLLAMPIPLSIELDEFSSLSLVMRCSYLCAAANRNVFDFDDDDDDDHTLFGDIELRRRRLILFRFMLDVKLL